MQLQIALSNATWEVTPFSGEKGCYAAVQPDTLSLFRLIEVCNVLGVLSDPRKFHCTVIYSPEAVPNIKEFNVTAKALLTEIMWWPGHNDKGYLSASLSSPELQEHHANLTEAGARHTYSPYNPHVTLTTGKLSEETRKAMEELNARLSVSPVPLFFDTSVLSDIKD